MRATMGFCPSTVLRCPFSHAHTCQTGVADIVAWCRRESKASAAALVSEFGLIGRYDMNAIVLHPRGSDEEVVEPAEVQIVGGLRETSTPWAGASLLIELFRASGVEAVADKVLPGKRSSKGLTLGQMDAGRTQHSLGGYPPTAAARVGH